MRFAIFVFLSITVAALPFAVAADWDVGQPQKWLQFPDLADTGIDVAASKKLGDPDGFTLAEDFLCTETGGVTAIHLWGSWLNDRLPASGPDAVEFIISFWSDIPASQSPTGFSMPGSLLWTHVFVPGEFISRPYASNLQEGWMYPPGDYTFPGDTICWQYNFRVDPANAFVQQGTAADPIVYWIEVQAIPLEPDQTGADVFFGWKTSLDHWNDDAVWAFASSPNPIPFNWNELRYPIGHPFEGQSIDLAFVLQNEPQPQFDDDFGDIVDPPYETLLANNGPRHTINPNIFLGLSIDGEADGQFFGTADGDDNDGNDDDDGVTFTTSLIPGQNASVDVVASVAGRLNAWMDFDVDGSFAQANDHFLVDTPLAAGLNSIPFVVPNTAYASDTVARFRFSTLAGLGYTGPAIDGEVEDYATKIELDPTFKWQQLPDLTTNGIDVNATDQFVLADDFQCTETGLITNIDIWGSWLDDIAPAGDPSNVRFTLSLHADIPADQSPTGYSMPGELLWMKTFDIGQFQVELWAANLQEGWMAPPADYIFPGDTRCWLYQFDVPPAEAFHQVNGTIYWLDLQAEPQDAVSKFGWKTSRDHWNDDGVWGIGVEPYLGPWEELIYPPVHPQAGESIDLAFRLDGDPVFDWGDAPDVGIGVGNYRTVAATIGANHLIVPGIHLGAGIDFEPDGQPGVNAERDDVIGIDDEDGVKFLNTLYVGAFGHVGVEASVGGLIDAWLDFDGDGTWAPATDQIFASQPVNPGPNILSFQVPAGAQLGTTFARFRFSRVGGLLPGGTAPNGEVEDYQVEIVDPTVMKWIQNPDLSTLGIDVNATEPYVLADDFLCTDPDPLTDFQIWGSWLGDNLPNGDPAQVQFTLSIHRDIPANQSPTGYSMPGDLLWVHTFAPGDFQVSPFVVDIQEGWMDPPSEYFFPADTVCWLYEFKVPPHEAFKQEGTAAAPIVYWLDLQARTLDVDARFGWKTSLEHWNDDAVWGTGAEPYLGPWGELIYPANHQLGGESIDLAFALFSDLVTDVPEAELPLQGELKQNAPNPFNPRTTIEYTIESAGHVRLTIFDARGRLVRRLVDEMQSAGTRRVIWDGRADSGVQVSSGVYFYRLQSAGVDERLKMILVR